MAVLAKRFIRHSDWLMSFHFIYSANAPRGGQIYYFKEIPCIDVKNEHI